MSLSFFESQLNPENARETAKAFANILYSQQNDDAFTLERNNLIRLLRSWSSTSADGHVPISRDVCSALVKQLKREENEIKEVLSVFEREVCEAGRVERVFEEQFKGFCTERVKKRREKQRRRRFIQRWDQEKLGGFSVKSVGMFDEVENCGFELFKSEDLVRVEDGFALDGSKRKREVLFAYSLLNLNETTENWEHFKMIVRRISKESPLHQIEKDFIYYLWNNIDKINFGEERLLAELVDNFSFLYEKPILKSCCTALDQKSRQNSELQRLGKISEKHCTLSNKIACIFCDLYFLSGQNPKVLSLYQQYFK